VNRPNHQDGAHQALAGEDTTCEKSQQTVSELETQSFLVRIWSEEGDTPAEPRLRGHVTQVGTGQRQYVKSLGEIVTFIARYLPEMGVPLSWRWRTKLWLQNWKRRRRLGT
jgi:hypothetical protein